MYYAYEYGVGIVSSSTKSELEEVMLINPDDYMPLDSGEYITEDAEAWGAEASWYWDEH